MYPTVWYFEPGELYPHVEKLKDVTNPRGMVSIEDVCIEVRTQMCACRCERAAATDCILGTAVGKMQGQPAPQANVAKCTPEVITADASLTCVDAPRGSVVNPPPPSSFSPESPSRRRTFVRYNAVGVSIRVPVMSTRRERRR